MRGLLLTLLTSTLALLAASSPAQAASCRSASAERFSIQIAYRGAGCKRVARLVSRWSAAPRCVSVTGRPQHCRVAGWACAPVDGGMLSTLAGAACLRERARIELTIRRACGIVPVGGLDSVVITTVSATCATAGPVARRWGRKAGCRDARCHVAAWVCKPAGAVSRCVRPQLPHQALELQRRTLIID